MIGCAAWHQDSMAAEMARDVRCDVHAGKALRMILNFAAMRHGKRGLRSVALYDDIMAAFVHATFDKVVAVKMACWSEVMQLYREISRRCCWAAWVEGSSQRSSSCTLRWHDDEASFSWSGGARYVEELAQSLGHIGDRAATKTPGTKATGSSPRDALVLKRPVREKPWIWAHRGKSVALCLARVC